jgi:hypothetical protein
MRLRMARLGVQSRADLVMVAYGSGLVERRR